MVKRIEKQLWYCCPCCGQKLLKVVDWDASCHGLQGICKKCKRDHEISVSREELETLMTEEERNREDKKDLLAAYANGLTAEELDWMLAFGRSFIKRNRGQTDGKRQAN